MVVLEDNLVNQWCWYIRPKKTKDLKHKKPNVSKKTELMLSFLFYYCLEQVLIQQIVIDF